MGDIGFSLATQVEQIIGNSRSDVENLEQLAPLIRNVCVDANEGELVTELEAFSIAKEREIERICSDNHTEFVGSVDKLLKVRKGTVDLKRQITELNDEVQDSGRELAEKKKGLIEARAICSNIGEAVATLENCLKILNMTNRIREYVDIKNFYAALRALSELQNIHLPEITQHEFVVMIKGSIPSIKQMIQDAVMTDLKAWLFDIREKSRAVGKSAFDDTLRRKDRWRRQIERNPTLQFAKLNSSIELVLNEENDFEALDNDDVSIDFTTLFECMHIFEELGGSREFKTRYANDRQTQKDLLLAPSINIGADGDTTSLEHLLWDITGFAIIEHFTQHKAGQFRTKEEVDAIWGSMTSSLMDAISTTFATLDDPSIILSMRNQMIVFIQTLEGFDFEMRKLNGFMLSLFEGYAEALKRRFASNFQSIADEDVYLPMSVDSAEDWDKIKAYCWYRSSVDSSILTYPAIFPFSQIYPLCCIEIRNFINEFYLYADELTRSDEVEDLLRRSLDDILVKCVNRTLSSRLPRQRLEQVVQMIINLENFEGACVELNKILNESRASTRSRLLASEEFSVTSKAAEKRIFELVDAKIDEFLEFSEYDWTTVQARHEPASYVQEMVAFLRTTIDSKLANLPLQIKGFVYFDALDHLADQLRSMIQSPQVRKITDTAVYNFNHDISFLEQFILSLADPVLEGSDTLGEIRQSINLLQSGDVSEYLDGTVRNRKYPRVKAAQAIQLLEKMLAAQSYMALDPQKRQRRTGIEQTLTYLKSGGRNASVY
ncbi:putative Exocyst complex component Sec15 [Taphrina deformans PYCC 5710]|uniref:Exocyst complex component SEC15 n=1 Tax=Taphrina deformans (strain PYCC 5710 / ATCC 11124 / CBS 356.35 / IMI 108563 / JCM 9778 / NBRC 8474) TaxID=1097556 RepID=R4X791_TAPDE|nr:putative Exocyst complex component Sec15 [Taphrina deformans PYCC 5710]|eukprot:CCG81161.1 putative Exocyst complex component Sec15 [Taphrina deformans PYCC 5710]